MTTVTAIVWRLRLYYLIRHAEDKVVNSIRTIDEAEAALLPFVPLVSQLTGTDTTLERIFPLMELLGNPQDRLRVVHIAGTSGKTSTAYYVAALLRGSGKRVGLTVSPHVDSVTERVQVDGRPLSVAEFCHELEIFLEIVRRAAEQPSYFELLYAFALWVFDRQEVEYAVIETGMGGLHDATNVTTRSDKVCVITDIGFDHMHVLGSTLALIAAQKIGIVQEGNVTFCYEQSEEIMRVFGKRISLKHAELQVIHEAMERVSSPIDVAALPRFQQRNWLLARHVYDYIRGRDGLATLSKEALAKTQKLQVPGRMDIMRVGSKTVVMDGAHNAQKMAAFIASFSRLYPGKKPAVMIALKEGKEYQAVTPLLAPLVSRVIVTTFKTSQDLPVRSIAPNILVDSFQANGVSACRAIPEQSEALPALLTGPEELCVITGSFYLLGQIRKLKTFCAKNQEHQT